MVLDVGGGVRLGFRLRSIFERGINRLRLVGVFPAWVPVDLGRNAVDRVVRLKVLEADVVVLAIAQFDQHSVALQVGELAEFFPGAGGKNRERFDLAVRVVVLAPIERCVRVVDSFDERLAEPLVGRGVRVVVAELCQRDVGCVERTPHSDAFRSDLLGGLRGHETHDGNENRTDRDLPRTGNHFDGARHRDNDRSLHRHRIASHCCGTDDIDVAPGDDLG